MAQDWPRDSLNIFMGEISSPVEKSTGTGSTHQVNGGPRAGAKNDVRMFPAGSCQIDDVLAQLLHAELPLDFSLNLLDHFAVEQGVRQIRRPAVQVQHVNF